VGRPGSRDHIAGRNGFRFCPQGFFISVVRALLVPGSTADPQAGQGAPAGWRAPPRAGPPRAGGHLLRAADRVSVESPGRDWARLGLDRAPALPGMGRGRPVLPPLARGGAALRRGAWDRLALACSRWLPDQGAAVAQRGRRAQPDRPWQARGEALAAGGRQGRAARPRGRAGQPQRPPAPGRDARRPSGPPSLALSTGPASLPRPRLRRRRLAAGGGAARLRGAHPRPERGGTETPEQAQAGSALGCGADTRLAEPQPPAAGPLGAQGGQPRRLPPPRLCPDLRPCRRGERQRGGRR
jgi:hypothetical protein